MIDVEGRINWENSKVEQLAWDHIDQFANKGLRTLVMGMKQIDEEEVKQLVLDLHNIEKSSLSLEKKHAELDAHYDMYE